MKLVFYLLFILYIIPFPGKVAFSQMAYDIENLEKHLSIIASDEFEGRNTGSLGQLKAARYISNVFRKSNLLPPVQTSYGKSYFQDVPLKNGRLEKINISATSGSISWWDEVYGFSIFYPTEKTLALEFVGFGIDTKEYSDYDGKDLKGKIAVMVWGEPKSKDGNFLLTGEEKNSAWGTRYGVYKKVKAARNLGAEDVIVIMPSKEEYESRRQSLSRYTKRGSYMLPNDLDMEGKKSKYGTLYTYPEAWAKAIGVNSKSFSRSIEQLIDGGKPVQTEMDSITLETVYSIEDVVTSNVLGLIPGSEMRDEYVVLTAHYDHIGRSGDDINNGADDDGSGTVALISIAQEIAARFSGEEKPKRSILFLAFTGEEKGLLGSKYYCDQDPVIPLENTVCNLNIDMIGRVDEEHIEDSNYVYLIGSDMLSTTIHEISERANQECCGLNLDYTFNNFQDPNNFYKRSDHYNFAKNNIPVIFYFNGSHEDYHKPTDTVDKINFDIYNKRTELIYNTLLAIANYEGEIVVDKSFDEPEK